uniref:DDE Tnp4 domain-containing protein n=1 Tax=Amphimedon queenslandica TaxID=400682 RepID=A0A1X7SE54_AMPQE
AQTYSSYKHHNTVKYLIGITPQGIVSYILEGWGGRTSYKYLTEHCTLLNKLHGTKRYRLSRQGI